MKRILSLVLSTLILATSALSAQDKPVTLHIIHWKTLGPSVIDKFQKENPNITIQFEQFPVDKFIQVIKTRIAANELPDILGAQEIDFPAYAKAGVYLDLTNEPWVKNLYDGAVDELKAFTPGGKVYTLPTDSFALGLWVNKDLFKKAGVALPTNYDELVAAAKALKAQGITPFVQGGKDGWPLQQDMMSMFRVQLQNPSFYGDLKNGKTKWTDKAFVDALTSWKADFAANLLPNTTGITYSQAFELLSQKKVAMWPMGSWATEFLKNSDGTPKKLDFDLGFIPLPSAKKGETAVVPGTMIGAMWAISAKSPNLEAAKKFFAFITKPENAVEFVRGGGVVLPLKGLNHSQVIPGADLVTPVLSTAKIVRPFNMTMDAAAEQKLTTVLQELILGISTPAKAAESLQKVQDTANKERK